MLICSRPHGQEPVTPFLGVYTDRKGRYRKLISLRDSRRGTWRLGGLEAREIWARDQIGNGIIEFWVDAESEIFDFRGFDDRAYIENLSKIYVSEGYLRGI